MHQIFLKSQISIFELPFFCPPFFSAKTNVSLFQIVMKDGKKMQKSVLVKLEWLPSSTGNAHKAARWCSSETETLFIDISFPAQRSLPELD